MEGYSLRKVIGEGSFGKALLVQCQSNQEKYVLKEVQLPKNQSKWKNSRREAVLLSRMKHPNIVAFRESFEAGGHLCIVMEYCSGGDLLQRIQKQKTSLFSLDDKVQVEKTMEGYSLRKVIGEGSFGKALLVQCQSNQEKYVLKEVQLPKNQSKWKNSRREAVLLSRMKHPNIVAFRESFEAGGHLCIVMEYCSGGDLLQRIQKQKTSLFSLDDILKWFAQMCAGTKHIHDKRVLHRDLKSKNIFLTDNGTAKLGDFGSACVLNSSRAYACTYVGTPYYVSPEIWDNKPYNNKSDVWSLGCVLYELCTLCHPFQAPSWKSLILKVCRGSYPPLPGHLPYELRYLIKHMFKTDPKDRPSLHTILTSHRISRLLHKHLPSKAMEAVEEEEEGEGRRVRRWRREEGEKVVALLGQKSLVTGSTFEVPSQDVSSGESQERRPRRQWDRNPPEKLLSLLEKAQLSTAFRTYTIHREGGDPLVGPLSQARGGDDMDGPEKEVAVDENRLEPRSDDEDTDFEEDSPCDWIDELEKMSLEH